MVEQATDSTTVEARDGARPLTQAVGVSVERQRSMCERLDALADDMCGPRSRQDACAVLDFMANGRFGAPDEPLDVPLPGLDEPPALPEFDSRMVRRMERKAAAGLEAIVLGRIPDDPLRFILAAYALVEIGRRYCDFMTGCCPAAAARTPSRDGGDPSVTKRTTREQRVAS